jgi:hypothetical protein
MAVGEWDQRQLCSDGACVGVIGPDGTCKVCGRAAPNWGDERNRGLIDPPNDDDDDDDEDEDDLAADSDDAGDEDDDDDDDDDDGDDEPDDDEPDDDESDVPDVPDEPAVAAAPRAAWSGRQLCPDGGCIGVIGPDGRCKVCGRRAAEVLADRTDDEPSSEPAAAAPAPEIAAAAPTAAASPAPTGSAATPDPAPGTGPLAASGEPAAGGPEPCPTPGCSGQIAADGRCAVCGKGAS